MRTSLPLARGRRLSLERCQVMGILNATPDSFSDGGELTDDVEARVAAMLREGADVLDVGGESTRPGHVPVATDEQLRRVVPIIEAVRKIDAQVPISIDTRDAQVARAALAAGADLVNDVSALGDPEMAAVVQESGCAVVLMRHEDLRGDPVAACRAEMDRLVHRATRAGVDEAAVVVDPGLGFGDPPGGDPTANLALVERLADWDEGRPVLIGASRKRFVGAASGVKGLKERVHANVAVAVLAAARGAAFVRVHDVGPTVQALRVVEAVPR